MLAQLADLRFCALGSLRPYVSVPLCPCALCLHPYVLRPYVGFRLLFAIVQVFWHRCNLSNDVLE